MITSILVAADGSDCSCRAVEMAADLAVKYDAELNILHVLMHGEPSAELHKMAVAEHLVEDVPPKGPSAGGTKIALADIAATRIPDLGRYRLDHKIISALGERVVANAFAGAKEIGAKNVTSRICEGDTTDEILSACQDGNTDLIVLGSRGLGQLSGLLLGSISQKVAQLAKCSCLIVH